jgi:hypothetical protein
MFAALMAGWQVEWKETPTRDSVLVVLAQTAFETGRWRHGFHNYNVGNIKHLGPNDAHDFTFFACDEDIGGEVKHYVPDDPACCFRAYPSLAAGVVDLLVFLRAKYASAWSALLTGSPFAFVMALKRGGYFTGPVETYATSVMSLFREFSLSVGLPFDLHTTVGLQTALNATGARPLLELDGQPGPKTKAAVAAFQRQHGLVPDGVAGPLTLTELARAAQALPHA